MTDPDWGVTEALARDRAARVTNVRYDLSLSIPADGRTPIAGRASIAFELRQASAPLALDFDPARADSLHTVEVAGRPVEVRCVHGHLVLAPEVLRVGENVVRLVFDLGEAPLNRTDDFLYTIFVPARAREALPCFDQPDLKARWTLSVEAPDGWQVLANGAETACEARAGRARFTFAETPPISTYLFAVSAGRLVVDHGERRGRHFRIFHREPDERGVARNREAIFDLHAASLDWLEEYTGIPYPFGKFDMLLIPAFQFGGMEHPGAIFYNAASVLLDESATQGQKLERANLIAHETAHLWFGDFVTMEWFSDVWVKEVFANVMAGKIVAPLFPAVNHALGFLHAHYPPAYDVDRTDGANAIHQPLANLREAGALYGAIIYHKAPIVMRQLETILGPGAFRDALREYLRRHAFGHASWQDLVRVFDEGTPGRVAGWSRAWVDDAGRPRIGVVMDVENGAIARLALNDSTRREGRDWTQALQVALVYPDRVQLISTELDAAQVEVEAARGLPAPAAVLPNGEGIGYGAFHLDRDSLAWLLRELPRVADPLTRGSAWLTLWDAMLDSDASPDAVIDLALRALPLEADELNTQRILTYLGQAYWRFTSPARRVALASRAEQVLSDRLRAAETTTLQAALFGALRDIALTPPTLEWLTSVWRGLTQVGRLTLAESDHAALAQELAVRAVSDGDAILAEQTARTANPDRRARLAFVAPALSVDLPTRDAFFAALRDASNRRREPWVLEGLRYLHHPLRSHLSREYIRPSLDLLPDLQRTGDIFFPKRWVDATLAGHQSPAAARIVRDFLDGLPSGYPDRLRRIVLSAADPLFRASRIIGAP